MSVNVVCEMQHRIRKDTEAFLALSSEGPVTWRRVNSDDRLARLDRAASKAAFAPANAPHDFIDRIARSPHATRIPLTTSASTTTKMSPRSRSISPAG
jgi:hypothetical protein